MNDELMNDELPSPPVGASTAGEEGAVSAPIEDSLDAGLLTDVPKMGEAIPAGTYAFRLDSFKEQWTTKDYKTGEPLAEPQPYFALQWKCQQEPHVGRVVFENVPWITASDSKAANDPQNPRRAEARQNINRRLPRAKEIMEASSFQPTGQFGFKAFLGTNPEIKLVLKVKERQAKGPDGKWHGTGEWGNEVVKHLSLQRPM